MLNFVVAMLSFEIAYDRGWFSLWLERDSHDHRQSL